MKIAITFAALAAASAVSFGAQTVFVAPGGSDSEGLGTKEKPFASLNRAIREFYSSKPGDFEICVAEGEYFFSKGVSIVAQHTNGKTLSIAGPNFSGEPKARFIGGIKIPAKYLEKVSDKETLSKIPGDAEGVLYKIDLKKFGVSEVGKVEKRGWGSWKTNGNPLETEAFFNRSPMTPARYPNDDSLLKIGEVLDTGKVTDFAASDSYEQEDKSVRGATFKYDFDRPSRWLGAPDAYLRGNFSVGWAYDQIKIKKIDPAAKTITLADPHAYGVRSNTPPKGSRLYVDKADLKVRGYQAFNLIEELDRVGEYYIDRKNLVFYTMLASAPKEGDAFYLSLAPDPIITMWNASNVKIRNIEFAVTRNSPIKGSYCNGVEIDKCAFRSCGKPFALDGVSYKKPEEKDCATFVSKNNKITNCKFFDNAMGGARIGGGNKRNLEKSNVLVYNCDFRRNALRLTVGGSALSISGVGVRVANCHISDQRQATFGFTGNDHLIENNLFERCCQFASDYGVIYTYSNFAQMGTVIRYNFFTNNHSELGSTAGVYVDESHAGVLVRHNIFCNTGSRSGGSSFGAIYIHGGCETRAEQNVFINCQSAFGSQTWTDEHYARKLAGEAEWRKNHVDVETGVYPKAYPKLAQILDPTLPRVNYAFDNKIFNSSMAMNGLLKLYGNSYIKPASESDADAIRKNPNLSIGDVRKYFGSDPLVKHILGRKIGLVKDPFSGE